MDSGRLFFDPPFSCRANILLGNADSLFQGPRLMMNMEETSKRRPFLSSPDEFFDEEYYDEQLPEKKRRLTREQVHLLEKSFGEDNKLEPERKTQLANQLGLQPRQVAVWFQNRRARWKTKRLEMDYDQLKSLYDSLLSDYDSLLKETHKLKTEVVFLTEKVQAKGVAAAVTWTDQKHDPVDAADVSAAAALQLNDVRVEDRLSTGSSGGSGVVDEDGTHLVVDSGDSYFLNVDYLTAPADNAAQYSEEDDHGDDGRGYFSDETEPMGFWVWS